MIKGLEERLSGILHGKNQLNQKNVKEMQRYIKAN